MLFKTHTFCAFKEKNSEGRSGPAGNLTCHACHGRELQDKMRAGREYVIVQVSIGVSACDRES